MNYNQQSPETMVQIINLNRKINEYKNNNNNSIKEIQEINQLLSIIKDNNNINFIKSLYYDLFIKNIYNYLIINYQRILDVDNYHKISLFSNIINDQYFLNMFISTILDKILEDKIIFKKNIIDINNIDYQTNNRNILFLCINEHNKLIVLPYYLKTYSDLIYNIEKYNSYKKINDRENLIDIDNIRNASCYLIKYSYIDNKERDIYICILCSDKNKYNKNLNDDESYKPFIDNSIDGSNKVQFKKLLILFHFFIEYSIKNSKKGGSLNKSHQLYMNEKDKYFIIYNKKNVYLNKKNTYKKGNSLYVKINKNLDIKIKN